MTPLAEPQEQPSRRMTAHEERRAKLIHLRPQRGVVLALREAPVERESEGRMT